MSDTCRNLQLLFALPNAGGVARSTTKPWDPRTRAFEPVPDIAIIGAGFSGSLTAIHLLAEAGSGQPVAMSS